MHNIENTFWEWHLPSPTLRTALYRTPIEEQREHHLPRSEVNSICRGLQPPSARLGPARCTTFQHGLRTHALLLAPVLTCFSPASWVIAKSVFWGISAQISRRNGNSATHQGHPSHSGCREGIVPCKHRAVAHNCSASQSCSLRHLHS